MRGGALCGRAGRRAGGRWRVVAGVWSLAGGRWRVVAGGRSLACGRLRAVAGGRGRIRALRDERTCTWTQAP